MISSKSGYPKSEGSLYVPGPGQYLSPFSSFNVSLLDLYNEAAPVFLNLDKKYSPVFENSVFGLYWPGPGVSALFSIYSNKSRSTFRVYHSRIYRFKLWKKVRPITW